MMATSSGNTPTPSAGPAIDPAEILRARFAEAIDAVVPDAAGSDPMIQAARGGKPGKGGKASDRAPADFQCNAAMALAKRIGANPRDVAEQIAAKVNLAGIAEPLTPDDIAGPGFINITLAPGALAGLLGDLDSPALGIEPPAQPETVVVDLCGVNLAKQMHVGHLRSTVIGDAVAKLFERLGHTVIRQSHVGDWGLPIAMVTGALMRERDTGRLDLATLDLGTLNTMYRAEQTACADGRAELTDWQRWAEHPKVSAEYEDHLADLEARVTAANERLTAAKDTLVKLQSGDADTVAVWQRIYDVTMDACLATCARLHANVTAEHSAGESSYREDLAAIVDDLLSRNIAEINDGAVIVRVPGIAEPCLVRKRDGGFLYATTDLAAIRRRVQQMHADRAIYCVDVRQSLHFRQVFGAADMAGYTDRPGKDGHATLEHAGFGAVLGEDKRPLKTRSGENVRLSDLVDEAVRRAGETVAEKNPDLPEGERSPIAERVGIAAIKYADLSTERAKDYVFSFDRMLAFEGNTGPYLLYALVRIRSIFRKATDAGIAFDPAATISIAEPDEKTLALTLLRYPTIVRSAAEQLEPSRLCGYLYELAVAFSGFFDRCPVLRADDEAVRASRLHLCDLTGRVLADGLATLGLPAVERM